MSNDWYLMKPPPTYTSGFENDDFNFYAHSGFEDTLDTFMGTDLIKCDKRPEIDEGEQFRGIVQNVVSDNKNVTYQRQILCNIGTLKTGDYVFYNNAYWLVVTLVDNNKIYEKAIVYYCNYMLRFLSPIDNSIVTYPIYDANNTQYNSGVKDKNMIIIGSIQHNALITYDEITIAVRRDKRFLIDKYKVQPTAYKLTQVDPITNNYGDKGVIGWTLVESQFNSKTDNAELMIANYYEDKDNSDNDKNGNIMDWI